MFLFPHSQGQGLCLDGSFLSVKSGLNKTSSKKLFLNDESKIAWLLLHPYPTARPPVIITSYFLHSNYLSLKLPWPLNFLFITSTTINCKLPENRNLVCLLTLSRAYHRDWHTVVPNTYLLNERIFDILQTYINTIPEFSVLRQ